MGATYTVRAGDTLSSIALAAGMDWRDLLALNAGTVRNPNPLSTDGRYNVIHPGMVLRLVGSGQSAPAEPAASTGGSGGVASDSGSGMLWVGLALLVGAFVMFSD